MKNHDEDEDKEFQINLDEEEEKGQHKLMYKDEQENQLKDAELDHHDVYLKQR